MDGVRYSYLHGPRRHVTIARAVDLEERVVRIGVSITHPSDSFDKKMGRKMAAGRLETFGERESDRQCAWQVPLEGDKPFETVMSFLSSDEHSIPTCVRKMAKEWRKERDV